MLETPVLFLVFNRPHTTQRVFEKIREAKPKQLFVAADGPRTYKEGEAEKCAKVRSLILDNIDWDCDVTTLFREENLGCKIAVSSAISWFFDHVEEGIILEDDTLPTISFFSFCSQMLSTYRSDKNIMHISGCDLRFKPDGTRYSYYFSKYPFIWGWATWRRAWKNHYDVKMSDLPSRSKNLKKIFTRSTEEVFWLNLLSKVYRNEIDTWDYQWCYAIWKTKGICITPCANLVSNIGFGVDATHTKNEGMLSNLPVGEIVEIKHPLKIALDRKSDKYVYENIYNPNDVSYSLIDLVRLKILSLKIYLKKTLVS